MKTLKNRFRLLLLLMVMPAVAHATSSVGLSTIISTFQSVTDGWYHAIFSDALGLFGALFGIEISWLAVTWMLGGKDVHDIFSSLVKKLISIGFFYTVLEYSAQWVPWIIGGFKQVAVDAGGEPITTVSDIAMTGIRAFVICFNAGPMAAAHDSASAWSDLWNLNFSGAVSAVGSAASAELGTLTGIDYLIGAVVGLILLFSFTYVVLELVAVQLEGMLVLSLGVIMLGFGGARWTTKFVESYMQYAVALGVRFMVLTLWASFIEWQVNPLIKTTLINGNASMGAFAIVLILALLVAWLTKKLPGIAGSILSGQSSLSGGELYNAVKGGAIAAAAVVTGGAALAVVAAGAAGAGAMGASKAAEAGAMGAAEASGGAMGASEGATAGVPAPDASAPTGATPAGVAAPDAGTSAAQAAPEAPTGDSGPVDHRPSAPNAPSTGGKGGAGGVQAPSGLDHVKKAYEVFQGTGKALHGAHDLASPGKPSETGVSAPSIGVKHLSD